MLTRFLLAACVLSVTASFVEARPVFHLSDESVCRMATINGEWDNRHVNEAYVREARRRGLTCGLSEAEKAAERERQAQKAAREEFERRRLAEAKAKAEAIAAMDPSELCNKAVNSADGEWDSRDEWKPYADEAKRRGLTCEDRKAEVRQQLAAAAAERERKAEAKRQADLLALQTNPMSVALAEEVALSLPFKLSLVPQMNDIMLCVQGQFRTNAVLAAEISKRGIRCNKLLELAK